LTQSLSRLYLLYQKTIHYFNLLRSVALRFGNRHFSSGAGGHEMKVEQRINYLRDNPNARITIDPTPLKEIIAYDRFVCHPNSSIAFDRAIKGSDIDEALVITDESVSYTQKRMFTEALKSQGFRVLHPEEVQNKPQEAFVVQFLTHEEILDFKREKGGAHNHMTLAVYYGGYQIDGIGMPRDDQESKYGKYEIGIENSFSPQPFVEQDDGLLKSAFKDIDPSILDAILKKFGKSM
jgi:hypothetical protein